VLSAFTAVFPTKHNVGLSDDRTPEQLYREFSEKNGAILRFRKGEPSRTVERGPNKNGIYVESVRSQ
jgi:hypothetical protein